MVAVVVTIPAPAYSQNSASPVQKNIANPDFPCGEPYGPNGEPPSRRRVARQIIFPDDEGYPHYLGLLMFKGEPGTREGETLTAKLSVEDTFCGASVISDHFIVTAAHCVFDATKPVNSVRLGDIDLTSDSERNSRPVDYEIEFIFVHPAYNEESLVRHNDLALLKTKDKIQFNDVVFPYCISDQPPPPGTTVTASGFGLYNATTRPDHLLEANFKVMDTKECEDIYLREGQEARLRTRYPSLLQGTDIICAIDDVADACQGDSGGPMFREKNGKQYLEGIVSGGADCRANFKSVLPGLYLSLAKHIDFINAYVYGPPPPGAP